MVGREEGMVLDALILRMMRGGLQYLDRDGNVMLVESGNIKKT